MELTPEAWKHLFLGLFMGFGTLLLLFLLNGWRIFPRIPKRFKDKKDHD